MKDNIVSLRKARIIAAAQKQRRSDKQRIKEHNSRILAEQELV